MSYRQLFIMVEGDDDERIIKHLLNYVDHSNYEYIKFWQYSKAKLDKTNSVLRTINFQKDWNYVFVIDLDNVICITKKKEQIRQKFPELDLSKVIIVIREIEGWYLAGVDENNCHKLKIKYYRNTEKFSKEAFDRIVPQKFSTYEFKLMLLKYYLISEATMKNASINYFLNKFHHI